MATLHTHIAHCTVGKCRDKVHGRGMCSKHYARWERHGSTESRTPRPPWFEHGPVQIEAFDNQYRAIHWWVRKTFPRVGRCEWCGATDRVTHYATAIGKGWYSRNRADWLELCASCHRRFDGPSEKQKAVVSVVTKRNWADPEHRARHCAALRAAAARRREEGRACRP